MEKNISRPLMYPDHIRPCPVVYYPEIKKKIIKMNGTSKQTLMTYFLKQCPKHTPPRRYQRSELSDFERMQTKTAGT